MMQTPDYERAAIMALETLIRFDARNAPINPLPMLQALENVSLVSFTQMSDNIGVRRQDLMKTFRYTPDAFSSVNVEDGKLQSVKETLKIQLYEDGTLRDLAEDRDLDPETVVSMNFWGFAPGIFPRLQAYFENFLRNEAGDNIKAECLLPVMVDSEMKAGQLEVSVLKSVDRWFGMTYREDREQVAEELRKLHAAGLYPETLRG